MLFSFCVSLCLMVLNLSLVSPAQPRSRSSSSALSTQHSAEGMMFAFYLSAFGLPQIDPRTQGSTSGLFEEAVLRAMVERYFSAYGNKDLAGVAALWSEKSPDLTTYKQSLQQQFTNEDLRFGRPVISRVKVEGEKASLRMTIALTSINLKSQQKSEQRLSRIFEFVKESVEWKVWRYVSTTEDLAVALVKANTEAERIGLLAEEKDLMTAELGRALLTQGTQLYRQGSYKRAIDIYKLALEIAEQLGDKGVTANALRGIGIVHRSQGNYTEALEHYQKSLKISEEISDKVGIASALHSIAIIYYSQGNYTEALERYRRSLRIYEEIGDKLGIARSLNNIGLVHKSQGNYTEALEHYQKSVKITEEIGDKVGISNALTNIGVIHYSQGNYTEALEQHQKSLKITEEIGDKAGISNVLNNIGIAYFSQGNYTQALEQHQKSLKITEEIGYKAGISNALSNIGIVHYSQGNNTEALEKYRKSLKIKEEIGDKAGIAGLLHNIGSVHKLQGNYTRALEQYQKSLKISEEIGDKAGIARLLHIIGSVYKSQDNYTQALEQYQKSLKISEEIGDRAGIATTLNSIGIVHNSQGHNTEALEQYRKSMKISEEIGDRIMIARALNNIGIVHISQGNYTEALEQYRKSMKISEEIGDKIMIASALSNIGEAHCLQGDYAQALQFAKRAAELATQIGSREILWDAHINAGKAYFALKQLDQARVSFDRAIATIEALRSQVAGGEREQQRAFESKISPYHAMVQLLIAQNNPGEALVYAERARARVLLDVLSSGRVSVTKTMTGPEIEQERELKSRLVALNTQIYREQQRQRADQDRLNQLDSQLQKARLDLEAFQINLYAAHPELKPQRGEAQIIKAEEIAALLPNAGSVLLEYVVTDDHTYLFAITKAAGKTEVEAQVYTLSIKRDELAKQTESFRQQLAERGLGFRAPARQLYQLLLKPAQAQIQGKTNLIIMPDDKLWELPFQALITEGDRYVIETSAVSYAPSLTVLREMKDQHDKLQGEMANLALLALGNPAIDRERIEHATLTMRNGKLAPLPTAEEEVKALGQFYGAARSKVYIGREAREDRVKTEGRQARVLHFATHGILNNTAPMYSHLLLAQGDKNEDGLLEAWELMQLDLKADLAVLSACETARGRFGAGEGMIGLSWAMFVAGVPATLVSQWKVESAVTRDLMLNFHRRLKAPSAAARATATRAEALRQAAMKLMKDPLTRHPFYWAGFVLVGDSR
jgi:CHAT domain-containing protein/tetratricopeptide (TPR) repeat protein